MVGQVHDSYGKRLLRELLGKRFITNEPSTRVNYKGNVSALVDGVIENCCAVEIESRVAKQVRGALVDLLEHPFSKKLLILIPAHMSNPKATADHCKYILEKYVSQESKIKVVLLKGTGDTPKYDEDKEIIEKALKELECL